MVFLLSPTHTLSLSVYTLFFCFDCDKIRSESDNTGDKYSRDRPTLGLIQLFFSSFPLAATLVHSPLPIVDRRKDEIRSGLWR